MLADSVGAVNCHTIENNNNKYVGKMFAYHRIRFELVKNIVIRPVLFALLLFTIGWVLSGFDGGGGGGGPASSLTSLWSWRSPWIAMDLDTIGPCICLCSSASLTVRVDQPFVWKCCWYIVRTILRPLLSRCNNKFYVKNLQNEEIMTRRLIEEKKIQKNKIKCI